MVVTSGLKKDIDRLERIQRQAARFITRDYFSRDPGCVTKMLKDLNLPTLQERRRNLRLSFLFKIAEGMLASLPPETYLTPMKNKRKTTPKKFKDCVSKDLVEAFKPTNDRSFQIPTNNGSEQYEHFFH